MVRFLAVLLVLGAVPAGSAPSTQADAFTANLGAWEYELPPDKATCHAPGLRQVRANRIRNRSKR